MNVNSFLIVRKRFRKKMKIFNFSLDFMMKYPDIENRLWVIGFNGVFIWRKVGVLSKF